jgi:uncharacterized membrane protein
MELTQQPLGLFYQTHFSPEKELALEKFDIRVAVTILRSPQELYSFWRNLSQLPLFMKDLEEVRVLSDQLSHWTVLPKHGSIVEWDAEVTEDVPGQMISWRTIGETEVVHNGTVRFLRGPPERGTIVTLSMNYHLPGGKFTELLSKVVGEDPRTLCLSNLRRLQALLEAGEIPTTEGQPSGRDENSSLVPNEPLDEEIES